MDGINKQKIRLDINKLKFINPRLKKNSRSNIIKNYIYLNEFRNILGKNYSA